MTANSKWKGERLISHTPERRRYPRVNLSPPRPDFSWAYFFDIDGTLAEIAARPDGVRVERDILDLLEQLFERTGGAVALLTGRSISDADRIFHNRSLPIAGQHGLERRNSLGESFRHEVDTAAFASACDEISAAVSAKPQLITEFKGLSVAIHYRAAPELKEFSHELISAARARLGPGYMTLSGKMVVELKPAGKDKGVAISEFLEEEPFKGRVPVFAGDDVTDEYGFTAINRLDGHSIKVGGGPTGARWRLRTVSSVRDWLVSAFQVNR
jgi:trehalose 6-phosphate phosphatase